MKKLRIRIENLRARRAAVPCAFLAAAFLLTLAACTSEETPAPPPPASAKQRAIVLNQGSYYAGIESTADLLDRATGVYSPDVFSKVNGQSLGADAQHAVRCGDRIYIALYGSNLIWKLDAATLRIVGSAQVNQPEALAAEGGYLFVTGNDGRVSRLDTLALSASGTVDVGPNPAGIVASGGYIYAAVSDGYNAEGAYARGFKVAKINPRTMTVAREIKVGMNPTEMTATADGGIFVACQGDYGRVKPEIWRIDPDEDRAAVFCRGTKMAAHGDRLYVIYDYTDYYGEMTYERELAYECYRTSTGEKLADAFLSADHLPANPYSIAVDPAYGDIYIGSYRSQWDFTSPGWLYRYASADGTLIARYATSAPGTCCVVFD